MVQQLPAKHLTTLRETQRCSNKPCHETTLESYSTYQKAQKLLDPINSKFVQMK
uniref:Uncharacterized protein n=1 Tax=Arundo donax TaxID=35708 RepID=A0A0A9AKM2_ARUDO